MMASELHVTVEPWGPDPDRVDAAAREALQLPGVRAELGGAEARLVGLQPIDHGGEPDPPGAVRATLYDYLGERALLVDVPLDDDDSPLRVVSTVRQPLPSPEELEAAVAIIGEHPELGPALQEGRLAAYRSMPPLTGVELPDGRVERTVSVGLRPTDGGEGHEIVGVRLGPHEVVRFEDGAPPTARVTARRCGLPDAGQNTVVNRAGAARITVTRDGEVLWRLIAVRPAASSGEFGSGVELRGVSYRGRRVLRRAHVPILNVRYDDNACGPFRDWQNEESRFTAHGDTVAPGFRLCPRPAQTILESGDDRGNFAGVAVYVQGEEVVLVSELAAGWYRYISRYISRWQLHADGMIRPRFGFEAVDSSCVCVTHHHHAYWRLDFDIAGAGDDVVLEHNDPPLQGHDSNWHILRHEIRRTKNPGRDRRWRVRTQGSNHGYAIIPGDHDGRADRYGVGDLWALRYRRGQIDDRRVAPSTRAALDSFVNGDSIVGTNVVVWYAGHFSHVPGEARAGDDEHDRGHIVGPTLQPFRWS
jgi:hypothetical protein